MTAHDPHLTESDCHLTLAALRFMQANLPQLPEEIQAILTNEGEIPLPDVETLESRIDALCESMNFDWP